MLNIQIMKKLFLIVLSVLSFSSYSQENISIDLEQGWNMFGYICNEPIDVIDGLLNYYDDILIVKNYLGDVYLPEYGFNGIGNLIPGAGYQIKLSETIENFSLCNNSNDNLAELFLENQLLHSELDSIFGCTVSLACNFDINALLDDESCVFPLEGYNCDGDTIEQYGKIYFYISSGSNYGSYTNVNEALGMFDPILPPEIPFIADGAISYGANNTFDPSSIIGFRTLGDDWFNSQNTGVFYYFNDSISQIGEPLSDSIYYVFQTSEDANNYIIDNSINEIEFNYEIDPEISDYYDSLRALDNVNSFFFYSNLKFGDIGNNSVCAGLGTAYKVHEIQLGPQVNLSQAIKELGVITSEFSSGNLFIMFPNSDHVLGKPNTISTSNIFGAYKLGYQGGGETYNSELDIDYFNWGCATQYGEVHIIELDDPHLSFNQWYIIRSASSTIFHEFTVRLEQSWVD